MSIERRKKKWRVPDPAKTTGRDNPAGGPSPAMVRSGNLIKAQEAREDRLRKENPKRKKRVLDKTVAIAQRLKHAYNAS